MSDLLSILGAAPADAGAKTVLRLSETATSLNGNDFSNVFQSLAQVDARIAEGFAAIAPKGDPETKADESEDVSTAPVDAKDDAEKDEQTPESPFKADVFEAEEASPIATDSSTTWEADLEEHPLQLGAAIDAPVEDKPDRVIPCEPRQKPIPHPVEAIVQHVISRETARFTPPATVETAPLPPAVDPVLRPAPAVSSSPLTSSASDIPATPQQGPIPVDAKAASVVLVHSRTVQTPPGADAEPAPLIQTHGETRRPVMRREVTPVVSTAMAKAPEPSGPGVPIRPEASQPTTAHAPDVKPVQAPAQPATLAPPQQGNKPTAAPTGTEIESLFPRGPIETPQQQKATPTAVAVAPFDTPRARPSQGESPKGKTSELERLPSAEPTRKDTTGAVPTQINSTQSRPADSNRVAQNPAQLAAIDMTSPAAPEQRSDAPATFSAEPSPRSAEPVPGQPAHLASSARPEVARDIGRQMAASINPAADGSIDIALSPKELGQVRMTLSVSETGVTLLVSGERAETVELMRRHAAELGAAFREMGYENIAFSFGAGGHSTMAGQGGDQDSTAGSGGPAEGPGLDISETSTPHGRGPAVSDGGLDMRL